jgi:hypothetical protein
MTTIWVLRVTRSCALAVTPPRFGGAMYPFLPVST